MPVQMAWAWAMWRQAQPDFRQRPIRVTRGEEGTASRLRRGGGQTSTVTYVLAERVRWSVCATAGNSATSRASCVALRCIARVPSRAVLLIARHRVQ